MNHLMDLIRSLSENDRKTLIQTQAKLSEENGELAKKVLPFEGAAATTHRFVDRESILEEVADVTLVALSIALKMGISDEDIWDMVEEKSKVWASLLERESRVSYPVPYEMHVTVEQAQKGAFKEACASLSTEKTRVKPIILDLQNKQGDNVFIDTMTSSTFVGDNNSAYHEMKRISDGLAAQGFKVIREKIETVPWHPAAPSKVDGNSNMPKDCYFETHFGVRTSDEHLSQLREFAESRNIHLSRNIFKSLGNGEFTIMLTYRDYDTVYEDFKDHVEQIETDLKRNFAVEKTIVEFSVYDTKISHDSSWLTSKGS